MHHVFSVLFTTSSSCNVSVPCSMMLFTGVHTVLSVPNVQHYNIKLKFLNMQTYLVLSVIIWLHTS